MKQKTLKIFLTVLLLLTATAVCSAASAPKKVAIVPTISQTGKEYPEVAAYCDEELYQNLRVPLNSILNIYEYVDKDAILAALPEITAKDKLHKVTPSRLKAASDATNADLIVGFIVSEYTETRHPNWDGEMILYSRVTLKLIGYDRLKDDFINLSQVEYFHDSETLSGHAYQLAKKAADKLLSKADFRKDVFPTGQKKTE